MAINCEKSCFDKIKNWIKTEKFKIGLVIGQSLGESDYIIHVVELASLDTNQVDEVERPTSLHDVPCRHISSHVGQVIRMLPGGLDVQGVFVICSNFTELLSVSNKLIIENFLKAIHEATSRYYLSPADCPSRKLLLYGCKKTDKIGAKSICVLDKNSDFTFRDVKLENINWLEINYTYSVERSSYLTEDSDAQSLVKDEKALLEPLKTFLTNGLILINGKVCNDAEPLNKQNNEKVTGREGSNNGTINSSKYYTAEFLENRKSDTKCANIEDSPGHIYTSGCVSGRAYLNDQASVFEAKTALRTDLMRSLFSRWQMHCDSLIQEPPEGASGLMVHEPPRRVFLEGEGLPVSLCDYLFPGDSVKDACRSAFELLGITISENNVDESFESFPDAEELLIGSRDQSDDENTTPIMRSLKNVQRSYLYQILIASFICIISIAFAYVFSTKEK